MDCSEQRTHVKVLRESMSSTLQFKIRHERVVLSNQTRICTSERSALPLRGTPGTSSARAALQRSLHTGRCVHTQARRPHAGS